MGARTPCQFFKPSLTSFCLATGIVAPLILAFAMSAHGTTAQSGVAPKSKVEAYNAQVPKTILKLQQFRRSHSISIRCADGRKGEAALVNLNPVVNAWYILLVSWDDGATRKAYHLENANPSGQRLIPDESNSSGIIVRERENNHPCDLSLCDARNVLDKARASQLAYAPLCDGRLFLRNPVKGHRTALEAVTDFLRDETWGGEEVITFVHENIAKDRYRDTAKSSASSGSTSAEVTGAGESKTTPMPALIDPKYADRLIVPNNLGITLESPTAKGVAFGAWYAARGNPGIYVSLIQPNVIAPEILQSYRTVVNNLDSVEGPSLCYLIAFDLDQFDLGFALGTDHPRVGWSPRPVVRMKEKNLPGPDGIGGIDPLVATGLISPVDARRTVATFTGGYKRRHGAFKYGEFALKNHGSHYGFMENGVVFSKLQPGLATLFVLADGSTEMKTWTEADNNELESIRYARQNGVPLIEFDEASQRSEPGPLVGRWGPGNWSGSADEKLRTLRAGAALQETGNKRFLIYALFTDATPSSMARVFQAYGCRYAMLLDMNALEHTYLAVYRKEGSKLLIDHLVKGMSQFEKSASGDLIPRFLGYPDNRDFFFLMRRSAQEVKP